MQTGRTAARVQPPVVYLPCRLDENGELDEVMMARLEDGSIALMGYTALDRFANSCGDAHPWVLWYTDKLEELRRLKHFDHAYLDIPMPRELRQQEGDW